MKYFVQDTRQYVGNSVLWWRDGGGYTTDIDQAKQFDDAEAQDIHRNRESDKLWPVDQVLPAATRHVDMQNLRRT